MLKRAPRLLSVLLLLPMLAGNALADHRGDQEEMRRLRAHGAIVPLEQLVNDARQRHPGHLVEAELKKNDGQYIYEVEMLDETGVVREFIYDAASGQLLEERTDD